MPGFIHYYTEDVVNLRTRKNFWKNIGRLFVWTRVDDYVDGILGLEEVIKRGDFMLF